MKVGLLGYGYWGEFVARTIARVAELTVIVDPNPTRMVAAREAWGAWGTRVASEAEVAYDQCEAVWVATPTVDHAGTVGAALMSGMHVLCEKPFVENERIAQELADAAEAADRALMIGHLTLHMNRHDQLVALTGRAKTVPRKIEAVRRNLRASLSDGSVLLGVGPHEIAPLVDLYGRPKSVSCRGTLHRVVFDLHFEDAHGQVELDWLAEKRLRCLRADGVEIIDRDVREPLLREMEAFLAACEGHDRERWLNHAIIVSETLERLELSRTGKELVL